MEKVTNPNVFMAWAMENKLELTTEARARITAEVRRLHLEGKISDATYETYLRLRKSGAKRVA